MDLEIGYRIKSKRKELNLTGAKIKELTGISTGNLSDIENGKVLPSATSLILLAQVFDCSIDYILLGKNRICEISISPEDHEWLELIHSLPADKKDMCKGYLKGVADASACSPKHTENAEKLAVGK